MGREFVADRKNWPSSRFFVTAFSYTKLESNPNQVQTLRFLFNSRIIYIFTCSLREYMPANDKLTELK